jgi:membrane-associated phospholipid phosphatase
MSLETALLVTAVPRLVKLQVQRIRPYVYNPDAPMQSKLTAEAKRSFFSGHTTSAFATAVFISGVYSDYFPKSAWKPYVWSASLLMASTIGYFRFESGKHFPTDIITGAVVGGGIGFIIPYLHRTSKKNLSLIPASTGRTLQLGVYFQF